MKKFSKNKKLNKVLNYIWNELEELGLEEITHYSKEFPNEIDYNLYQYGNLTIYNDDIENIYRQAGYKSNYNFPEIYKRQVGYLARKFLTVKYLESIDEFEQAEETIEDTNI